MAKKKFYAVKNGRETGVFSSWDECKDLVSGFSGAEYKSFSSLEEARNYLGLEDTKEEVKPVKTTPVKKSNKLVAYVDGSFSPSTNKFGCGVVLLDGDNLVDTISKIYTNSKWSQIQNVAGELVACNLAVTYAKEHGYDEVTVHYDYMGIEAWATGQWKAKNELTKKYKAWFDEVSEEIKVNFVKVKAHSGDKYNEMADELAGELLD